MLPNPEYQRPARSERQLKMCRPSKSYFRDNARGSSKNNIYLVSCDEWTWNATICEGGTGGRAIIESMFSTYGQSMTYVRLKPSGATTSFTICSTAVGPIAAKTLPDKTGRSTKSVRKHTIAVKEDKEWGWERVKAWRAWDVIDPRHATFIDGRRRIMREQCLSRGDVETLQEFERTILSIRWSRRYLNP